MLFNSFLFGVFFVFVFGVYWFLLNKKLKLQNLFLLVASYVFYGVWDWRFLGLIALSSSVDYLLGIQIDKTENPKRRKTFLFMSIGLNIGLLFVFKYFNFFADNLINLFNLFGFNPDRLTIDLLLPVGISFYTFQTLSYTIDIYKRQLKPTHDPIAFFGFVSFFPQLVAGPIEKARDLLPQFKVSRTFDKDEATSGLRQVLFGLFKKIVIADNCAPFVNEIFNNYETLPSSVLVLGLILFSFQIYGDFSGYSDMAIGVARMLGFKLTQNFNYPFFSTSMAELWRKWHISLSTWTGEYLFVPISKSRKRWGRLGVVYALMCTFLILGFWHGANWTFVAFGLLHGTIVSFEYYFKRFINQRKKLLRFNFINNGLGWLSTMSFWLLGMLFFRSVDIGQAFDYLFAMFTHDIFPSSILYFSKYFFLIAFIGLLVFLDWINRKKQFGLDISSWTFKPLRWSVYYLLIFIMLRYTGNQQDFIYFQF